MIPDFAAQDFFSDFPVSRTEPSSPHQSILQPGDRGWLRGTSSSPGKTENPIKGVSDSDPLISRLHLGCPAGHPRPPHFGVRKIEPYWFGEIPPHPSPGQNGAYLATSILA